MYPDHFDKEDLIRCGHGQLFPGAMRLPIDEMLMVDRITHVGADDGLYGKGSLVAELDINPMMVLPKGQGVKAADAVAVFQV